MTAYTVTLTEEQDAAVTVISAALSIDKVEYIQSRASDLADDAIKEAAVYQASLVSEAYKNADVALQTQIKSSLGI